MGSKLYVGGLLYSATESQLTSLFAGTARSIGPRDCGQIHGSVTWIRLR